MTQLFTALANLPHGKLRITIALLLTLNALLYAALGSMISAIDAFAWLALLLSFELETAGLPDGFQETSLHKIRNGLLIMIGLVSLGYLLLGDLLNVANALFWFALIALLEIEVRAPQRVDQYKKSYWLASVIVFVGLVGMVVLAAWMGALLDAYNNALWLIAFALIEVDLFRFLKMRR